MKYLILLLVLFSACASPVVTPEAVTVPACKYDSLQAVISSHENIISAQVDRLDSFQTVTDTLKKKLFLNRYKVERVKFYLAICRKNPSQDKFLKGWIRRAVEN